MFYAPITGVIGTKNTGESSGKIISSEEVPLASGWIIGIIGLIIIIALFRKKAQRMEEETKIDSYMAILDPYISEALKRGYSQEIIRSSLLKKKWSEHIIDSYFKELEEKKAHRNQFILER